MRYNGAHVTTRSTVERLFEQWKRRFPALHYGLRLKLMNIPPIIVAAAVIHNIAINNRDEAFEDGDMEENNVNDAMPHLYNDNKGHGNIFRRRLIERVFT